MLNVKRDYPTKDERMFIGGFQLRLIPLNKESSIGVDLAGSVHRNTGIACMRHDFELEHSLVHDDREIIEYIEKREPGIVVIDAPLSLPVGRESLEKKSNIHFRECDYELRRRHIPFFPLTLGPMRKLTARGIALAQIVRRKGLSVLEGYPGGAQDILGIPRKGKNPLQLEASLRHLGLKVGKGTTHDELDAITCAYVGLLHLEGKSELIGDAEEGQILLPLPPIANLNSR